MFALEIFPWAATYQPKMHSRLLSAPSSCDLVAERQLPALVPSLKATQWHADIKNNLTYSNKTFYLQTIHSRQPSAIGIASIRIYNLRAYKQLQVVTELNEK